MTVTSSRPRRDLVTVEGPDAVAYLQGQLSQDVAALAVGEARPTFVLAPQGKVDGWGQIERTTEDRFVIEVDAGAGPEWEARLRRFLLRTNATITVEADVVADEGAEVDAAASEAARIRAGVPRWGAEIDHDTIPATLGQRIIDASVSFTKGCYTGQELVARIDSRGGNVPQVLAGVVVDAGAPAVGEVVEVDGAPVGPLTSAAPDATVGGGVGLVFVPRSVPVPDGGLDATVAGRAARLVPLPIDGPA